VASEEHVRLAQKLRETLAVYKDAEDLINIGAYKAGANPKIDRAVRVIDAVNDFLKQKVEDPTNLTTTIRMLQQILMNT
jgi:flagellum-specific ATP synthase